MCLFLSEYFIALIRIQQDQVNKLSFLSETEKRRRDSFNPILREKGRDSIENMSPYIHLTDIQAVFHWRHSDRTKKKKKSIKPGTVAEAIKLTESFGID